MAETRELLRSVGKSYRAYRECVEREEPLAQDGEVKKLIKEEKSDLESRLTSLKSLLASAQELISSGVASKDMHKVKSGNVLLSDVNSKLPSILDRIKVVDSALEAKKLK